MECSGKIGQEIKTLNNLLMRQIEKNRGNDKEGSPTQMQCRIIGFIRERDGGISQKDIETEFSIRRSTATGILKLMEQNGLITRTACERDMRIKIITLTERANEMFNAIFENLLQLESELSEGLSRAEISEYLRISEKIRKNLERK